MDGAPLKTGMEDVEAKEKLSFEGVFIKLLLLLLLRLLMELLKKDSVRAEGFHLFCSAAESFVSLSKVLEISSSEVIGSDERKSEELLFSSREV